MLWLWAALLALGALVALYGFALLRYFCARRELGEGWEERFAEKHGGAAQCDALRAGRAWLSERESEEIEIQSEDGFLLHALLIPHVTPRATVICFHGWNSSWELDFLPILPFLYAQRMQLLLVDERAQGDSEGRWMTLGVREREDVPLWAEYAAGRFGRQHPIFLYGMSMGASAVLAASAQRMEADVRGVVADCAFDSPCETAARLWRERTPLPANLSMWLLDCFARLFADFSLRGHDTVRELARAAYPVLFIHGAADTLVPAYVSRRAYEACGSEKRLVVIDGAEHCMSCLTDREQYEAALLAFLQEHC